MPGSAPPFDLPLIDGLGYVKSTDLFPAHEFTFLIFWDSNCPRCVESLRQCQAFYEEQLAEEITVVGLHADEGEPFEMQRLIETSGIFFPQVWDIGGSTGRSYSVSLATFTIVLVDRHGTVVDRKDDPQGDMKEILTDMLSTASASTPEAQKTPVGFRDDEETTPVWSAAGLDFRGDLRLRFLSIDSRGIGAVGPYGEELRPGNDLLYRFDLGISRNITRHLRVGGLLRIGNEDERILEAGPDYLGSEWGSAFAEITACGALARFGYYRISLTPLTLMRWDWEDNPRIGGSAGCGCAAAAGVLLVESLEELGPELLLEGGVAKLNKSGFETRAFWAIPRRASHTDYREVRATGADRAKYSLETYGFEGLWRRADQRTDSFWKAGIRIAGTRENRRSVNFNRLGYPAPDPWSKSVLVSADWNVPIVRSVDFRGEWILWNEAEQNAEACCDTTITTKGYGGLAGVVFEKASGWSLRCDYLYLDSGFYSPFAALSYQPNRQGVRFSAQAPVVTEIVSASFFYKRLRETDLSFPGAHKENESFFSTSLDLEFSIGIGCSLGWLDNGVWRNGPVEPVDDVRRALVVETRYRFNKTSSLQAQFQRIDRETTLNGTTYESLANLFSVYMSAQF
ncbi:MAG: TlpA family protein disulfide reductase [Candidatus Latescibacterota bacterium]|nr:MAG: TlpA family protein disulfide reductase [Candidatus Latescibacterota bacterium]